MTQDELQVGNDQVKTANELAKQKIGGATRES